MKYTDTSRARYIYRNNEPNNKHGDQRNKEGVMMSHITQHCGPRSEIRAPLALSNRQEGTSNILRSWPLGHPEKYEPSYNVHARTKFARSADMSNLLIDDITYL